MGGDAGGGGNGGRKGGGGGSATPADAGQPGEVVREANLANMKKSVSRANEAINAKQKELDKWPDKKLSSAITAIRENQHLDPNNRAEDRVIRARLKKF